MFLFVCTFSDCVLCCTAVQTNRALQVYHSPLEFKEDLIPLTAGCLQWSERVSNQYRVNEMLAGIVRDLNDELAKCGARFRINNRDAIYFLRTLHAVWAAQTLQGRPRCARGMWQSTSDKIGTLATPCASKDTWLRRSPTPSKHQSHRSRHSSTTIRPYYVICTAKVRF